jgi:Type I restriction modification DNA specificity domain
VRQGWTEAETRAERIDRQLAKAGWSVDGIDFEAEFEVGSAGEPDHGFSDYMLPGTDGVPLAIVEAKRSSRDALAGKEQARNYATAIADQFGRRPMTFLANGDEIWYWDPVENPRRVGSFFRSQDLERRFFQAEHSVPLSTVPINTAIVERPYQHEAIRRAHEAIEEYKRRMLFPASMTPPGEYPLITTAAERKTSAAFDHDGEAICVPLASSSGHGHASINRLSYMNGKFAAATIVAVLQVRDTSIMLPRFLYYFLEAFKEELLVSLMKGAANVSLTPTKIGTVEVPVPPLELQGKVISSLEEVDDKIDEARQRVALLQGTKQDAVDELRGHFTKGLDADLPNPEIEDVEKRSSAGEDVQQLELQ